MKWNTSVCSQGFLALFVAFTLGFLPVSHAASPSSTEMLSDKATAEDLYLSISRQIDALERRHPDDQAALFKVKLTAEALLRKAQPSAIVALRRGSVIHVDGDTGTDLYAACQGLKDSALRDELLKICGNQVPLGYQGAQAVIFEKLDNRDGIVECIYTGRKIQTSGEPDATNMNVEHSWPQSLGAVGIAKCDLHHLFPADAKANGKRGNYPFGMISKPTWEEGGSRFDGSKFEIRPIQRGNTARGMFYFAVRYGKQISDDQETVLRQWSKEDPIDEAEKSRNNAVENIQHNRNPFVDHPEFVDQIKDF
ncbi:MAG: endonuclease [Candidatus Ozemobacteraceae bacterium]